MNPDTDDPRVLYPMLFTPATLDEHKLSQLAEGGNELVRRLVIDTEDAVAERDVDQALDNLEKVLDSYTPSDDVQVYVRVRNVGVTKRVLRMAGSSKLAGFVVPKAEPLTYPEHATLILDRGSFGIIPILESREIVDYQYRRELIKVLTHPDYQASIECLQIGVNDLMSQQAMRRPWDLTIYDTIMGGLIANIVNEFRGSGGFVISAPVFELFGPQYDDLFREEVRRHVANRLLGQIVIHPRHLPLLWQSYSVGADELRDAKVAAADVPAAVAGIEGKMVEAATHANWGKSVLVRAELFGEKGKN